MGAGASTKNGGGYAGVGEMTNIGTGDGDTTGDSSHLLGVSLDEISAHIDDHSKDGMIQDLVDKLCSRSIGSTPMDLEGGLADCTCQGEIQIRKDNMKWKTYYGCMLGTRLLLYKTENALRPSKVLPISYCRAETFDITLLREATERLPNLAIEVENQSTEFRFRVYHTQGVVTIRANDDVSGEKSKMWQKEINDMLDANCSGLEMTDKEGAAKRLDPHLFEQIVEHFQRAQILRDALHESGLLTKDSTFERPIASLNKIKGGHIELRSNEDSDGNYCEEACWTRCYFCLLPGHLYAYEHSVDTHPVGHLLTHHLGVKRSGDDNMLLLVSTPLRTFELKMKDKFQMFEWVHGLMRSTKSSNCGDLVLELHAEINNELENLKTMRAKDALNPEDMVLVAQVIDNEANTTGKSFQLSEGENTVGRDPSNKICIVDGSLSRFQARIDIKPNGEATITDLNSGNGTRVNSSKCRPSARVTKGDVLELGKTCIVSVSDVNQERLDRVYRKRQERKDDKAAKGANDHVNLV